MNLTTDILENADYKAMEGVLRSNSRELIEDKLAELRSSRNLSHLHQYIELHYLQALGQTEEAVRIGTKLVNSGDEVFCTLAATFLFSAGAVVQDSPVSAVSWLKVVANLEQILSLTNNTKSKEFLLAVGSCLIEAWKNYALAGLYQTHSPHRFGELAADLIAILASQNYFESSFIIRELVLISYLLTPAGSTRHKIVVEYAKNCGIVIPEEPISR